MKMMVRILVSVLVCLAATAALADLDHDVRCREISFSQSAEVRDIQAFRSFIDADARFVSNEVLRGGDAIAEAWAVFFTEPGPTIRWRPEVVEVLENGTLALSRGPYRVVSQDTDGNVVGGVLYSMLGTLPQARRTIKPKRYWMQTTTAEETRLPPLINS
jgi:ketosteroid isomerase-like protein